MKRVAGMELMGVLALVFAGCGGSSPPPASNAEAPASASSAASSAASASGSAAAPEAPPPPRPLDLASACSHDVHLYFGDQPGDGKGQAAIVATGANIPVPRGSDGSVVVWVTDDKGFGLASVHATKHMRHVRIDATCSRIEADSTR